MSTKSEKIIHEKAYFHISNSGITVEISSIEHPDVIEPTTDAKLSVELHAFGVPLNVEIPIMSTDFLQVLSDMCLRAKQTLGAKRLHYTDLDKPKFKIAWSKPVPQRAVESAASGEGLAVVNIDHSNGDLVPEKPE